MSYGCTARCKELGGVEGDLSRNRVSGGGAEDLSKG
jgi:hypothetical protein